MRVSFKTNGCRLNQAETASLEQSFAAEDYQLVDFKEPADIVIVNTCTVTEGGDTDTRRLVNKAVRTNPRASIVLIGCQAQTQKDELAALPNVKLIVGNAEKMNLVDILHDIELSGETQVIAPPIPRTSFTVKHLPIDRVHTRANLKIQDGCDFFCSFCEIPYARGRARSRVFDDVLREARGLVAAGYKEIVITGINVGTYSYEDKTIVDIIDALDVMDGLKRIRISSIEPTTIPMDIVQRMGKTKLCRHMHIPLQSGSDSVLTLMNRKYTAENFTTFVRAAHAAVDQLCIGVDVMVGFPGETDEDFGRTRQLLEDVPLAYFHVFSYSDRRLNKSRTFKNKVPLEIIQKRSKIIRGLSVTKRRVFMESLCATQQHVLFEQTKDGWWTGLTDHYVRVNVRSSEELYNCLRCVRCQAVDGLALSATLQSENV